MVRTSPFSSISVDTRVATGHENTPPELANGLVPAGQRSSPRLQTSSPRARLIGSARPTVRPRSPRAGGHPGVSGDIDCLPFRPCPSPYPVSTPSAYPVSRGRNPARRSVSSVRRRCHFWLPPAIGSALQVALWSGNRKRRSHPCAGRPQHAALAGRHPAVATGSQADRLILEG